MTDAPETAQRDSDGSTESTGRQVTDRGAPPSEGLRRVTLTASGVTVTGVEDTTSERRRAGGRDDPYIGCTVDGRYEVDSVLGEGGMGIVYLCRHTIIGKQAAMKVLRADLARNEEVTERFLNEAKSASAIGNPHIIDISDFGQLPDGSTYFIMEFLDGHPLSDMVENEEPVPIKRIVGIAKQLCEGLFAAHEAGIVHRDLKPDNIFLVKRGAQNDFVKILDFGIAKASSAEGKLTQAGAVFGTPHYMSPEQAAGAPIDHRADIYSFGVILYELASGKVPFDADNFMGILTQHMYKSPVPIRALVPQPQDVPPGLEAIILKCLSKRPEQRYQSMQELLVDMGKLESGNVPDAVPEMMNRSGGFNVPQDYFKRAKMPVPVPATPADLPRSRWPLVAGLAGVGAAIGLVVAIFAKSSSSDAAQAAPSSLAAAAPEPVPSEAPPAAPQVTSVVLGLVPHNAHAFRDEEDLGESPVVLDVTEGEPVTLVVKKKGYQDQEITLDGLQTKLSIELEKKKATQYVAPRPAPARPASSPKPKKKSSGSSIGGGEIVNPWE